jgi:hypothetical protein
VTQEELAGFCSTLGMPLESRYYTEGRRFSFAGAFWNSSPCGLNHKGWQINLQQGPRSGRHSPSKGSGYTTLSAKHISCGSLPFGQRKNSVMAIYIGEVA